MTLPGRLSPLPRIMVAPNGARRSKADHPALPITVAETVAAAAAAFDAGATALHAHVRNDAGEHCLDPGRYHELIAEMQRVVPDMAVQITTESGGTFDAATQARTVREVLPEGASVALREMWPDDAHGPAARSFYHWAQEAGIVLQHILYTPQDAQRLAALIGTGDIPSPTQCLFVLGAYAPPRDGAPEDLAPMRAAVADVADQLDWAVCAFGGQETACLEAAYRQGGGLRIGFENNIVGPDGHPAQDNAARVAQVLARLRP